MRLKTLVSMASDISKICVYLNNRPMRLQGLPGKVDKIMHHQFSTKTYVTLHKNINEGIRRYRVNPLIANDIITKGEIVFHPRDGNHRNFLAALVHGFIDRNGQLLNFFQMKFAHDRIEDVPNLKIRQNGQLVTTANNQAALRAKFMNFPEFSEVQAGMYYRGAARTVVLLMANTNERMFEIEFDPVHMDVRFAALEDYFYFQMLERVDSRRRRGMTSWTYAEAMPIVEDPNWRAWP